MNKLKKSQIEEDIMVETESSNTSIINVEEIVKSNNKNNFVDLLGNIEIEKENLGNKVD